MFGNSTSSNQKCPQRIKSFCVSPHSKETRWVIRTKAPGFGNLALFTDNNASRFANWRIARKWYILEKLQLSMHSWLLDGVRHGRRRKHSVSHWTLNIKLWPRTVNGILPSKDWILSCPGDKWIGWKSFRWQSAHPCDVLNADHVCKLPKKMPVIRWNLFITTEQEGEALFACLLHRVTRVQHAF